VGSCTPRTSTRPSAFVFAFEAVSVGIATNAAPVAVIGIAAQSVRVPLAFRIGPQQGLRGYRGRGCDSGILTSRRLRGRHVCGRAASQCDEGGAQSDAQAGAVSHETLPRAKESRTPAVVFIPILASGNGE
jgi:hypothetical protein